MKRISTILNTQVFIRNYVRQSRREPIQNPGIERQMKEITGKQARNVIADDFDDAESDFLRVGDVHKNIKLEEQAHREKLGLWIVKQKYFKEKSYNFLTWAEKEKIRQLHELDPNEWDEERLTESFPADIFTIAKIIKSRWQPRSAERVLKHDLTVKRNWQLFREGKLNDELNDTLQEHLARFTKRDQTETTMLENGKKYNRAILPKPESNEFSSIITECVPYKNGEEEVSIKPKTEWEMDFKNPREPRNEMFMLGEIENKSPKRLNDLKSSDSLQIAAANEMIENPTGTDVITLHVEDLSDRIATKHKSDQTKSNDVSVKSSSTSLPTEGSDRIRIPKKFWKSGATYRVQDCYYDDDGEFLYRVIGMTRR